MFGNLWLKTDLLTFNSKKHTFVEWIILAVKNKWGSLFKSKDFYKHLLLKEKEREGASNEKNI